MKIRKISLRNDTFFGDLDLDFTNSEGTTLNTIIVAGDNGVGKTYIIKLIQSIYQGDFNIHNNYENPAFHFVVEFDCPKSEVTRFQIEKIDDTLFIDEFNNYRGIFSNKEVVLLTKAGNYRKVGDIDLAMIRMPYQDFNSNIILSNTDLNYTVKPITSTTAIQPINQFLKDDFGTNLAQHLVNLKTQDALDLAEWVTSNPGQVPKSDIIDLRMIKFSNAFHHMFPKKRFIGIKDNNNTKEIQFKEFNRIMNISQLSSGEKQIVFRASHILSSIDNNRNNCVLIDEPELSLHPDWQKKIVNFFKILFDNSDHQLFVATHSPFIIHNENRFNDKVIILKKDEEGNIKSQNESKYYNWTNEEVVKEAFGVSLSNIPNNTIFVEGRTDEDYIKCCIQTFNLNIPHEVHWIGSETEKGKEFFTGETSLDRTKDFILSKQKFFNQEIILLYDCDCKQSENNPLTSLKIRKFRPNAENSLFKKGIENLLNDIPSIIPNYKEMFYSIKTKTNDYGANSTIEEFNKTKFCNFICTELNLEEKKRIFMYLKQELQRIVN